MPTLTLKFKDSVIPNTFLRRENHSISEGGKITMSLSIISPFRDTMQKWIP